MAKKRPYRYLLYLLLRFFEILCNVLPRGIMFPIADLAGFCTWHLLRKEQKKVLQHLKLAFRSEKNESELHAIGLSVFQNLGRTAVDVLRSRKSLNGSVPIDCSQETFSKIDHGLQRKKGLLCLTAHFGNWELITGFIIKSGYAGSVVGKRIYYEPFNRLLERLRTEAGAKVIYRDESPKSILQVLKNNEIIGILPDQDVDSIEGIFVRFFGEWAYTPTAPAKISLASGAPILPFFMVREGMGYRLVSDQLILPEAYEHLSREEAVRVITEHWTRATEKVIQKYPEQWVWMHRRWKTRPDPEMLSKLELTEKMNIGKGMES